MQPCSCSQRQFNKKAMHGNPLLLEGLCHAMLSPAPLLSATRSAARAPATRACCRGALHSAILRVELHPQNGTEWVPAGFHGPLMGFSWAACIAARTASDGS